MEPPIISHAPTTPVSGTKTVVQDRAGPVAAALLQRILDIASGRAFTEPSPPVLAKVTYHADGSYTTLAQDGWKATRCHRGKILNISSPAGDQYIYHYDVNGCLLERQEVLAGA